MSSGRILVVDDEPRIRRIMRTTLARRRLRDWRRENWRESAREGARFLPGSGSQDIDMPAIGGLARWR